MRSILVISNKSETIPKIKSTFPSGYQIEKSSDMEDALGKLNKKRYDFIVVDLQILKETSSDNGYKEALQPFKDLFPTIEIIIMTPLEMIREAVSVLKAGASDYITHPIEPDELKYVINNIRDSVILKSELDYLRDKFWKKEAREIVQTENDAMKQVYKKIQAVAPTKTNVLLIGETGTGKSLLAKLIHRHSNRQKAQFIEVHCGAIPETLLESELFGHEKGAFTGAVRRRLGKFEIAKDGTIFLDEIGTLTPSAQVKLLQVLQDGKFSRVGGEAVLTTNARVVAATNSDLKEMSENSQFRNDLYYRLNVFPIEIPPLRERIEDLPFLFEVFLSRLNMELSKNIHNVHPHVLEALKAYSWPGNIREMENLIERAYILEESSTLNPESFPGELFQGKKTQIPVSKNSDAKLAAARRRAVDEFETQYLKDLLSRNQGKMKQSANDAGIGTRQLHKLLMKYGLRKEEFRSAPL